MIYIALHDAEEHYTYAREPQLHRVHVIYNVSGAVGEFLITWLERFQRYSRWEWVHVLFFTV